MKAFSLHDLSLKSTLHKNSWTVWGA